MPTSTPTHSVVVSYSRRSQIVVLVLPLVGDEIPTSVPHTHNVVLFDTTSEALAQEVAQHLRQYLSTNKFRYGFVSNLQPMFQSAAEAFSGRASELHNYPPAEKGTRRYLIKSSIDEPSNDPIVEAVRRAARNDRDRGKK